MCEFVFKAIFKKTLTEAESSVVLDFFLKKLDEVGDNKIVFGGMNYRDRIEGGIYPTDEENTSFTKKDLELLVIDYFSFINAKVEEIQN